MSSPTKEKEEEPTSSTEVAEKAPGGSGGDANAEGAAADGPRPPAKRRLSSTVIEISDTESDDSDVCAVTSYQASADEVKRIRGEEYSSSSSSSSSYSSDSESACEDESVVVADSRPRVKALRSSLNPRAGRMEEPKINTTLKSQEVIDNLKTHWQESKDYSSDEVTLTCDPFRVCLLHDFLENSDIINNIVDDMNTLDWTRKKMDLYEFHQTADLSSLTWQRGIKGIYELLKTDVMNWVSKVTGLELTSVSASCSLYGPGDHLLVHDDQMSDRRVAFILYAAPWQPTARPTRPGENGADQHDEQEWGGWSAAMGGALQLVSRDEAGRAAAVARDILPRNNMLAFFAVGPETFHQVAEVTSLEVPRLSINGWFHGPAPPGADPAPATPATPVTPMTVLPSGDPMETEDPPAEECPASPTSELKDLHTDVMLLNQWVESTYMSPRNRAAVQAQMERESEASLQAFLRPEALATLMPALEDSEIEWELAGPSNLRRYHRLAPSWSSVPPLEPECRDAEHPVRALLRLLGSQAFARLLGDCTDLPLHKYQRLELQKWTPGCYSLLPPRSRYTEARLETVLYLGSAAKPSGGGQTTYTAPEDPSADGEGALVTVPPVHNALSLVYCDPGAASFTKYLSKMTTRPDQHFYLVTCTYRE